MRILFISLFVLCNLGDRMLMMLCLTARNLVSSKELMRLLRNQKLQAKN
jgi:hypothetical protein